MKKIVAYLEKKLTGTIELTVEGMDNKFYSLTWREKVDYLSEHYPETYRQLTEQLIKLSRFYEPKESK